MPLAPIWEARLWGPFEMASGLAVTSDGIYIAGFWTSRLAKFNAEGDKLWNTSSWGTETNNWFTMSLVAGEEGVYLVGYRYPEDSGFILKYDGSGNLLWQVECESPTHWYEGVEYEGYLYVVGTRSYFQDNDVLLAKYDAVNGSEVWCQRWGQSRLHEAGYGITLGSDGGLYVAGVSFSQSIGRYELLLMNWSLGGELVWTKEWYDGWEYICSPCLRYHDGFLYVAAVLAPEEDVFLFKFDLNGVLVWKRSWGSNEREHVWDVDVGPSGRVYLTGDTFGFGAESSALFIVTYDGNGDLLFEYVWDRELFDGGEAIEVVGEDCLYVAGTTGDRSDDEGRTYALLMRFGRDSDGDGLADQREAELGTDPDNLDTDGDGLADGREVEIGTDPVLPDTDGDGWLDGVDLNPLSPLIPNILLGVGVGVATSLVILMLAVRRRQKSRIGY